MGKASKRREAKGTTFAVFIAIGVVALSILDYLTIQFAIAQFGDLINAGNQAGAVIGALLLIGLSIVGIIVFTIFALVGAAFLISAVRD